MSQVAELQLALQMLQVQPPEAKVTVDTEPLVFGLPLHGLRVSLIRCFPLLAVHICSFLCHKLVLHIPLAQGCSRYCTRMIEKGVRFSLRN